MGRDTQLLSISEVADATGLRPSALRYYEEAGLIASTTRRSNRRYFTRDVLDRLALIALCQDVGFTISEIALLFGNTPRARQRWQELAQSKLVEIDAQIERAQTMKALLEAALECSCGLVADCDLVAEAAARRMGR